jgi:GDPmannose 4,6-dehydratase
MSRKTSSSPPAKQYSVRDFVDAAAKALDLSIRWEGSGVDEKGYDQATGACIVSVDPRYFRPTEVETLLGDPTKAREKLGWEPEVTFEQLVAEMVRSDLAEAERETSLSSPKRLSRLSKAASPTLVSSFTG